MITYAGAVGKKKKQAHFHVAAVILSRFRDLGVAEIITISVGLLSIFAGLSSFILLLVKFPCV